MPKTNPIPQLSIVVPHCGDNAAFESTLISVLEHQPASSEVIVPHDGTYEDPFDLSEEVRFVESNTRFFTDMVGIAAHHARGRFVHLLGEGLKATEGWTNPAVKAFDHFDTASVAPVICEQEGGRMIAAGWSNGFKRLGDPCLSLPSTRHLNSNRVGAYLPASFWRRDVLRSLNDAFDGCDVFETSMVYHYLLRKAGWRTELASESFVSSDEAQLLSDRKTLSRGMRLAAIRNHFGDFSGRQIFCSGAISCGLAITSPSSLLESLGQLLSPLAKKVADQIHLESVLACDDSGMIVTMPSQAVSATQRRVA